MKPGYEPKTLLGSLHWLCEESHEAGGAIAKTLRFTEERGISLAHSLFSYNPDVPVEERELNIAWILRECDDLLAALVLAHSNLLALPCISGQFGCGWKHRTFTCTQCKRLVCYCQGDDSKSCAACLTKNRKKKLCSPKTRTTPAPRKRSKSPKSTKKRGRSRSR